METNTKTKRKRKFLITFIILLIFLIIFLVFIVVDHGKIFTRLGFFVSFMAIIWLALIHHISASDRISAEKKIGDEKKFLKSMEGLSTKEERSLFILGAKSALQNNCSIEFIEREINSLN